MSSVISVALPVFAVIAAGIAAGHWRFLEGGDVAALNRFVFRFAMPAALFGLTARAEPIGGADLALAASYGFASLAVIFSAYALSKILFKLSAQEAGAHAFASTLGNAVFLGLPIALAIPGWGSHFVVLMLVEGIIIIAIGSAMMSPQGSGKLLGYFIAPFKNPLVIGMVAGLLFSLIANAASFDLPGPVASFFDILGRAAGPTALFSLGLFLATSPKPNPAAVAGKVALIAAMKMIAMPALMFGALYLFGVTDPLLLGPAALFTFVPVGIGAFVMAGNINLYTTETAAAITVTTAISIFTISAVLAYFA